MAKFHMLRMTGLMGFQKRSKAFSSIAIRPLLRSKRAGTRNARLAITLNQSALIIVLFATDVSS